MCSTKAEYAAPVTKQGMTPKSKVQYVSQRCCFDAFRNLPQRSLDGVVSAVEPPLVSKTQQAAFTVHCVNSVSTSAGRFIQPCSSQSPSQAEHGNSHMIKLCLLSNMTVVEETYHFGKGNAIYRIFLVFSFPIVLAFSPCFAKLLSQCAHTRLFGNGGDSSSLF